MITTDEKKRDFIAEEIRKSIIGPGYSQETYACDDDASDEVIDFRPNIIYTAGILFPKRVPSVSADEQSSVSLKDSVGSDQDNSEDEITEDVEDPVNDTSNLENGVTEDEDSKHTSKFSKMDNQVDISNSDRPDFEPNHIGLVMCLNKDVDKIEVDVNYGIYHLIKSDDIEKLVKVHLGRCALEQLKSTFEYYDASPAVKTLLKPFSLNCMDDLFSIDEDKLTISPKKLFSRKENGKEVYLRATDFPSLPPNLAVGVIRKLMDKQGEPVKLVNISWDDLKNQINRFEEGGKFIKKSNQDIDSFVNELDYLEKTNEVRTKRRDLSYRDNFNINSFVVDDPVKDHLLKHLLQYRFFFKREQISLPSNIIDFSDGKLTDVLKIENSSVALHWKLMYHKDYPGYKYLKVLLQNTNQKTMFIDKKDSSSKPEEFLFQAEMTINSDGIVPYTQPHRSVIDDEEYSLNEELYRDIPVYGKGVNCAVVWDQDDTNPLWVKTTYFPRQKATAYSPLTEYDHTNNACDVYDLSIWSTLTKEEVIARLRSVVSDFSNWHESQKRDCRDVDVLKKVLQEQEEFKKRLEENINYLSNNGRAYNCFMIANTAMYIQMCIAKDEKFKKNRDLSVFNDNDHLFNQDAWDYFSNGRWSVRPKYRPFQLAFLVMNIKSTFEAGDPYRKNNVDLIWFPTGGGKTEAYLALTALTIAERRTSGDEDVSGVSVIMRYTLRLLTAQQFERASFLICALEYLRKELINHKEFKIALDGPDKDVPITLGMWIGSGATPNKISDLGNWPYKDIFSAKEMPAFNPFPIAYCPWCGCKLTTVNSDNQFVHGYNRNGEISCLNKNCAYHGGLPIYYIDEKLYNNPPTLLFATVDKFAQLNSSIRGQMFGAGTNRRRPDLIIQDELHLISGPLGSLVGMYETMIEEICTDRRNGSIRMPKIVASTATTRNTNNLIKQLYTRQVRTFPVSGISYKNNFFSHALPESEWKRLYVGLAPTGHSAIELELRSIAAELVAKEKLLSQYLLDKCVDLNDKAAVFEALSDTDIVGTLSRDLDNYWSLVLYYNNLKSLGQTHSRIGQEILSTAESMRQYLPCYPSLKFIIDGCQNRATEFTSRQESSKIKELLISAESPTEIDISEQGNIHVKSCMDIIQATNMISVGIDISRWNVMFMNGQPLTTAEYIQSSSRVGRSTHGLVVNLYNSLRNRELSFYENYIPYHKQFYKFVEPLSVMSFTPATFEKLMANLYLCYMSAIKSYDRPNKVEDADVSALKDLLKSRNSIISPDYNLKDMIETNIDKINKFFRDPKRMEKTFNEIVKNSADLSDLKIMSSLRDIETNTYIKL